MNNQLQAIIEGILFVVGDDGIALSQLALNLELNEDEVLACLDAMSQHYVQDNNRGIELVCFGGKYKLVSKAIAHSYCQKLFGSETAKPFSQAALETLAIIAYKGPITRVEIEEIRGVSCDMMIRKLQARNLIKEHERLDTIGKPFTYVVTEQFMDSFSLKSLDELPELPDFKNEHEGEELFD